METELFQAAAQTTAGDMAIGSAIVSVSRMVLDVVMALGLLWALSGNHRVGRALFPFADELRDASKFVRGQNMAPEARASILRSLALVAAARVLGFFILLGCLSII